MYKGKILDKPTKVSNRDYNQLLRKFNLKNIEEYDTKWEINVKCSYCFKYNNFKLLDKSWGVLERPYCKPKCPFAQFETDDEVGCMNVMRSFVDEEIWPVVRQYSHIGWDRISWKAGIDTTMRGLITSIRSKLLKMKKV